MKLYIHTSLAAALLAGGCAFTNPDYNGAASTTGESSTSSPTTAHGTSTSPTSTTTLEPTTDDPSAGTTSGTSSGPTDSTDPSTGSTSTSDGTASTDDPTIGSSTGDPTDDPTGATTIVDPDTETETDTEGLVVCTQEPQDSPLIEARNLALNAPQVGNCETEALFYSRPHWVGDKLQLEGCITNENNCECGELKHEIILHNFDGVPNITLDEGSISPDHCISYQFTYDYPGGGKCGVSALVIRDAQENIRLVATDGQMQNPVGVFTVEEKTDELCLDCDCCGMNMPQPGYWKFKFSGGPFGAQTILYEGETQQVMYQGYTATAKNVKSLIPAICEPEGPPPFAWLVGSLPIM